MKGSSLAHFKAAERRLPSHRIRAPRFIHGERFLQGPIPMPWLSVAAALPGKSLHLALAIWMVARLEDSQTGLRLNARVLGELSLGRWSLLRALRHLEGAELIGVSRGAGRKAVIAILPAPAPTNEGEEP